MPKGIFVVPVRVNSLASSNRPSGVSVSQGFCTGVRAASMACIMCRARYLSSTQRAGRFFQRGLTVVTFSMVNALSSRSTVRNTPVSCLSVRVNVWGMLSNLYCRASLPKSFLMVSRKAGCAILLFWITTIAVTGSRCSAGFLPSRVVMLFSGMPSFHRSGWERLRFSTRLRHIGSMLFRGSPVSLMPGSGAFDELGIRRSLSLLC